MHFKKSQTFFLLMATLSIATSIALADQVSDPCNGTNATLAILDRPSNADSACVVPYKSAMLEMGVREFYLATGGNQQVLPQAEFRVGLPLDFEAFFLLPNYVHENISPRTGSTATSLGFKHRLGYNASWLAALEAILTLPNGSDAFGSKRFGTTLNGIVNYNLTSQLTLVFMLGVSTLTQPGASGGERYSSINPDIELSWQPKDTLSLFAEVFGTTRTGPTTGSGYNADVGIVYLLLKNLTIDAEFGQRLGGTLGGFDHYVGAGLGIII